MNFIALDFETATHERNSACELGICVVENSEIVETKSWLIKPPSYPYFNSHNINVHGIYPEDVKTRLLLTKSGEEVEKIFMIKNQNFVKISKSYDCNTMHLFNAFSVF